MTIKELLKKLFPDKENEINLLEETEKLPEKTKQEVTNPDLSEFKNLVDTMKAENDKLLKELTEIRLKESEREKLLQEKANTDKVKQIDDFIKKVIEEKKLPAKNEVLIAKYKTLLGTDFENTKTIMENLPVINNPGNGNEQKNEIPVIKPVADNKTNYQSMLQNAALEIQNHIN